MGSADSIDGRRETKELRLIEFARRLPASAPKAPEDWRSPRPGPRNWRKRKRKNRLS